MPAGPLPPEFSRFIPDLLETHAQQVVNALIVLPLAAAVGAALAFRPRRRGTPPRSAPVIQTQITLSIVGGSSLARAFGIVGAANLIRYRAKIDDPKDAAVMLSTLSLGLATGVGLYGLAVFGALFILAVLWAVESLEPESRKAFELKITAPDPAAIRTDVEAVLRRYDVKYEMRGSGAKELAYEAHLPMSAKTDRVSNAILLLEGEDRKDVEVTWEEKTKK
jgi:uncharacterized membrane protein YhiD involved in acid resistance